MKILTVKQFVQKHPWPTESALRALIYHNKIDEAVFRSGRRVLIDEERFFEILKLSSKEHKGEENA